RPTATISASQETDGHHRSTIRCSCSSPRHMKNEAKVHPHAMTRRGFVGRALAAGFISGAPAFLRGQNLNSKLDIAFIACGGRASASLGELTIVPGRSAGGEG